EASPGVVSPGPYRSVGLERMARETRGAYRDDIGQPRDLGGSRVDAAGGPVAKRAVRAIPAGPYRAVRSQCEGVEMSCGDGHEASGVGGRRGDGAAVLRHVAELAVEIPPPGDDAPVATQRQGMAVPGRHLNHVGKGDPRGRMGGAGGRGAAWR